MTGFDSKRKAALDEEGMYLVHPLVFSDFVPPQPAQEPQRPWVGLTDEEIAQGCKESWVTEQAWQSAVWWAEAKLKEKNNG
jgi:hypothetical protein